MDAPNSKADKKSFAAYSETSNERFHKVQFEQARLVGTQFYDCVFSHCALRESVWQECKFNDCTFEHCDLSLARFDQSAFSETQFTASQLVGVNWTLAAWSRFQAEAPLAFDRCVLDFGAFIGLKLRKLAVKACSAQEVEFSEADLSGADFSGTDLAKSRFQHTNLTRANFEGARNYTIDLATCTVTKARFALPEALALLYGLDIVLVE